jgi:hypothetical protein
MKRIPKHTPVRRLDLDCSNALLFFALAANDPGYRDSLSYVEELENWVRLQLCFGLLMPVLPRSLTHTIDVVPAVEWIKLL